MYLVYGIIAVLAVGLAGTGAYAQEDTGLSGDIQIGLIAPLTGAIAQYGEENRAATQLAVDDFNAYLADKGAGWSLDLIVEDSQALPTAALEKLQAMHARDIKIVLGPMTSSGLQSMKVYVDSNSILMFSCCSTSPSLAISGDAIFRMSPEDSALGVAVSKLMREEGIEVVVPVWREDAWGVGLEGAARESFEFRGGTVDEGFSYSPEASEFSASTSLLAERVQGYVGEYGSDSVGVMYMGFEEVLIFMQSASDYEVLNDVRWFGSGSNAKSSQLIEDPIGARFAANTGYTEFEVTSGRNDLSRHVDESLEAELGRVPTTFASSAYDSVWLLGLAMERTQGIDVAALAEAIPEVAAEYTGAIGSTRLNEYGDLAQTNYGIWEISDGAWVMTGTFDSATDAIIPVDRSATAGSALDGVVQIGALLPVTGDASSQGEDIRITVEIAEDDFNQYLQEIGAGWSLDVVIEDTATSPVIALDKIASLKSKGISAIAGTYSSAELRNIRGYAQSNDMLLVSYGSTAPSLSIPGDNIFRFVPDETRQSPAIARYLAEAGITNLVPIWRGDAWGDGLIDAVRSEFTKIGGVMDEGVRYHPETIEFSSEVSLLADIVGNHVAEVGEDRVAVVVVTFTEITPITQSASPYESLSQVLWFSTDTVVNDAELASDAIAQEFLNKAGLVITAFAPASNPVSERVSEQAAEISGKAPNIYALSAYDVIWGLGLSILEADSTETEAIISVMPTVLEDYPGALGSIVLNDAGDMAEATYDIYSVREPVWTLIGSYDSASDLLVFVEGAELGGPAAGDEAPDDAASDDVDEGGCLIATAAYGSELAPQVQFLRELRDNSLLSTASGTSFMTGFNQFYYSFSPAVADLERENAAFRDAVRTAISPGIYALNIMTLADPGSEFSVVAFGLLSIAAVAGIYVVAPSLAVHAVARRIRSRQARPI